MLCVHTNVPKTKLINRTQKYQTTCSYSPHIIGVNKKGRRHIKQNILKMMLKIINYNRLVRFTNAEQLLLSGAECFVLHQMEFHEMSNPHTKVGSRCDPVT